MFLGSLISLDQQGSTFLVFGKILFALFASRSSICHSTKEYSIQYIEQSNLFSVRTIKPFSRHAANNIVLLYKTGLSQRATIPFYDIILTTAYKAIVNMIVKGCTVS